MLLQSHSKHNVYTQNDQICDLRVFCTFLGRIKSTSSSTNSSSSASAAMVAAANAASYFGASYGFGATNSQYCGPFGSTFASAGSMPSAASFVTSQQVAVVTFLL